jgi:hypothetical protein
MRIGLIGCALLLTLPPFLSSRVAAQTTGDLWEISTQMNIPGMPAGMGAQTQRVCQGDDPERSAAQSKDRQSCKVKDKKQTATRLTMTMVCAEGTMTIDQQYNAAHTEFRGTMKMASKEGDMTMNTVGRKVGTCDVQEARRERDAKGAAMKKQADDAMAQGRAQNKAQAESQLKQCAEAVDTMQHSRLGVYGQCYRKNDSYCKGTMDGVRQVSPEVVKGCTAQAAEFCKRYQTQEGFLKAKANQEAAAMCGVTTASIKAAQCPRALKNESLAFLGAYCPVEAKPIAQVQCAGRDYTSKMGGKYNAFCTSYLANADFENGESQPASRPAAQRAASPSRTKPATAPAPQPEAPSGSDAVQQGINQGLDKLKGMFGR